MTKRNIVKLSVNGFLIVVLVVALIVGNSIAFRFEQEISTLLSPPIVDEEAMAQSSEVGQEMSRRIMEEGAVLLKNNGALPLDKSIKQVNVFGWRSVDWIYGSEGRNASGGVAPEDDDFNKNVDLCKALNAYGVQYNRRLYDMYCKYRKPDHQSADLKGAHISELTPLKEPKINDKSYYTDDLLSYSEQYSDTALVVISRMAGEAMNGSTTMQEKAGPGSINDNTRHYLELSTEEEALLKYCGEKFENVIVLMNMSNPFECGFLDTIEGIDACLYLGFTGTRGAASIPKLLYGNVSPSGKTVDIFPYDMFTNPGNVFLSKTYSDNGQSYMDITENIYVGYKWYETADAEGVWDEYGGYDKVVQFPFGHGLSYTEFDWTVKGFYLHNDKLGEDEEPTELAPNGNITDKTKIDVVVNVKNTGNVRGRDVVEVYVTPQYYEGEIEKASVSLVGFNKTNILEPQADEDITITLDAYDFASYDCYGLNNKGEDTHTGWELDAGKYTLSLRTDSHTVKDVYYKDGKEKQAGSFDYNVAELINIDVDPVTESPVDNLFTGEKTIDAAPIDANSKDGTFTADIPWFTRSSFVKPSGWSEINTSRAITPDMGNPWDYNKARAEAWDNAKVDEFGDATPTDKPTWGAKNGLKLAENNAITDLGKKLGENYDADEWGAVLDQVTPAEFVSLTNRYYGSAEIGSVGKPWLRDLDGPAQIKGFNYAPRGTGYPTMVTVAQTWNPNLAYEFGKAFGDDMKGVGVMGVWGWAIDMHRSAFFGRNHESPSEDAYLAGRIITNAVKGLNTRGRYCFLKHFALYGYGGTNIWTTEQGLREIYLRPFRMAFVEGGALGCMTTYQGVGGEHSETTVGLLTGVLRKEWKFKGAITTDYIGNNVWCDSILRAGGNLGMGVSLSIGSYNESSSARLQQRMRESVKQVLYMWLHADYNERMYIANPDQNDTIITTTSINTWSWWQPMLYSLDVFIGVGCALWLILVLFSVFLKSKNGQSVRSAIGGDGATADALVYGDSTAQNEPFHAADVSTEADAQSAEITIGDGIEQEPEPHVAENETAANVADAETAIADGSPETEQATETIADGGESATVAEGGVSARDEEQTEVAHAVEMKEKPKKKSTPRTYEERAADYEQRAQNAEVRAEKAKEQAIKYKIKAESARTKSKGGKKQ